MKGKLSLNSHKADLVVRNQSAAYGETFQLCLISHHLVPENVILRTLLTL